MSAMEPACIEETSTENAKISDSGYSNTCSNSQSHTSSGSSVSRNSNRSASSGYHGGNPSTFGSRTETLPKPITKRKEKGYKKKKSKNASCSAALLKHVEASQIRSPMGCSVPIPNAANAHVALIATDQSCKPALDKKAEEVAVIELVDVTDPEIHNDNNLPSTTEVGLASKTCPIDESSSQFTEEYHAVISMHDGLVLHATPALHAFLNYPKDSWTGQLFIDFLDPKDKHVFAERIASEIAISRDFCQSGTNGRKASIFCRLRRFNPSSCTLSVNNSNGKSNINHELQSNVIEQYEPCRINMVVQNYNGSKDVSPQSQVMLLVTSFHPLRSAYKEPDETIIPTVFTTRHTATCRLSYVDPDVVQYLGYLPQDMIDRSLFDFYHPEDLPLIKDIYETVINLDNSSYRSKPYRYIVQNGCYVYLETEWSSFVNPWTKNLEFIVGHHRVLKGPSDPNVFRSCPTDRKNAILANISEDVLKEAKVIQMEIRALLVEGVQRKHQSQAIGRDLLFKKKDLDSFVENILQEIKSPAPIKDHMAVDDIRSFSGHGSVMLGEISPHHEYFDSKSSTETPPSYNQLNYHDNIVRFFNSNIGVGASNAPYASDEENPHSSANSSDEPGKNNATRPELQCTSSTNGSGNSGSAENLSSESNNQQSFESRGETSNTTSNSTGEGGGGGGNNNNSSNNNGCNNVDDGRGRFKPAILTESLLNRHNEDMEKLMIQKHREQKKGDKRNKSEQKAQKENKEHQQQSAAAARCDNAGNNKMRLKRSGSQSWEGDNNFKISKHDDSAKVQPNIGTNQIPTSTKFSAATNVDTSPKINKASLQWPPISTSMPTATNLSHQCFAATNACSQARLPMFPQMFPIYYLPVSQARENSTLTSLPQEHPGPSNPLNPYCYLPVPYMTTAMPSLMYPPIIGAPTPTAMMYRSFIVPETVTPATPININLQPACPPETTATQTATAVAPNTFDLKRPASRATSDKAELGSTMAMSESSKKIFSPSGIVSSCMSNEGGCYFSSSINKTCSINSSSNTDQRHTSSSFEMYHDKKESRANQTRKAFDMVRKEPPWIEGVKLTRELIYQYQIGSKSLSEILKADLDFLRHSKQPSLVNDQLGQLFLDLDITSTHCKLILDETGTNSASDSSSDGSQSPSRMGAW